VSKASEGLCRTASSPSSEALQYEPSDGKSPGAVQDFLSYTGAQIRTTGGAE